MIYSLSKTYNYSKKDLGCVFNALQKLKFSMKYQRLHKLTILKNTKFQTSKGSFFYQNSYLQSKKQLSYKPLTMTQTGKNLRVGVVK